MGEIAVGDKTTVIEPVSHQSQSYYLRLSFVDSGTDEDKVRTAGHYFSALLRGIDWDDTDLVRNDLGGSHYSRIQASGMELVPPKSRREITNALVEFTLAQLLDRVTIEGEIERVVSVQVQERVRIRETPFEHQNYGGET